MPRNLRSGTRKDYKKMASGEEENVINGSDNDGDASGSGDIFPSDSNDSNLCSPTPSDAEIEQLENSLREKLALKKKLEKKEKLRQLSKELKEVEKHSQKEKLSLREKQEKRLTSLLEKGLADSSQKKIKVRKL